MSHFEDLLIWGNWVKWPSFLREKWPNNNKESKRVTAKQDAARFYLLFVWVCFQKDFEDVRDSPALHCQVKLILHISESNICVSRGLKSAQGVSLSETLIELNHVNTYPPICDYTSKSRVKLNRKMERFNLSMNPL